MFSELVFLHSSLPYPPSPPPQSSSPVLLPSPLHAVLISYWFGRALAKLMQITNLAHEFFMLILGLDLKYSIILLPNYQCHEAAITI